MRLLRQGGPSRPVVRHMDRTAETKLLEKINNNNILKFLHEMLSEEEGNHVGSVCIVVLSSE